MGLAKREGRKFRHELWNNISKIQHSFVVSSRIPPTYTQPSESQKFIIRQFKGRVQSEVKNSIFAHVHADG